MSPLTYQLSWALGTHMAQQGKGCVEQLPQSCQPRALTCPAHFKAFSQQLVVPVVPLAVVSVSFPVFCLHGCLQLTPASCQHLWVCFYRWRCRSSLWQVCPAGSCAKVMRAGHAFRGASNCQESLVLLQSWLFGCLCWGCNKNVGGEGHKWRV